MKILIYTFRTDPFKRILKKKFKKDMLVFGRLNESLIKFEKKILKENPKFIIGCAKTVSRSKIESKAVNKFEKTAKVSHDGKRSFKLFIPKTKLFKTAKDSTHSFCNWSMYKLAEMIYKNKLKTKLIFVHFKEDDINKLIKLIESLT